MRDLVDSLLGDKATPFISKAERNHGFVTPFGADVTVTLHGVKCPDRVDAVEKGLVIVVEL